MKFVKEDDEKRRDHIFQKNTKTKVGSKLIITILIILGIAVLVSGGYFGVMVPPVSVKQCHFERSFNYTKKMC